jgi:phosphate transport system substrate-binding protein
MKKILLMAAAALAFIAPSQAQSVRVRGSDTLGAKLVPQLAEGFKKKAGGVSFNIAAEGSSTAFTNLAAGTADIGMSSRKVKDDERTFCKTKGVFIKEHQLAWDMMAVIVNKNNPVQSLTKKQVAGIFTGAIKDWSEVGGTPGPISIYTRNTSSGTYRDWMALAMGNKDYAKGSQKLAGNEQIAAEVGSNKGGVGYVGLAYLGTKGVKAVPIDGVAPVASNVAKYPYSRPTYLYTNGEPQGAVKDFLDFCKSGEGLAIIQRVGFVVR